MMLIANKFCFYQILEESKNLLLNIASPDAIMRVKYSKLSEFETIFKKYFKEQRHDSLKELLASHMSTLCRQNANIVHASGQHNGLLLQVTTHSHLLTNPDVIKLGQELNADMTCYMLQEFDTEMGFCNKLRYV